MVMAIRLDVFPFNANICILSTDICIQDSVTCVYDIQILTSLSKIQISVFDIRTSLFENKSWLMIVIMRIDQFYARVFIRTIYPQYVIILLPRILNKLMQYLLYIPVFR